MVYFFSEALVVPLYNFSNPFTPSYQKLTDKIQSQAIIIIATVHNINYR